ncbi:hypothetical protein BDZ91DRAFT_790473 [Kalaharituber pfeilii]|nr:hypothetical protein BDZ91DRAFT_790473 [Kalaharituber pfeilii]
MVFTKTLTLEVDLGDPSPPTTVQPELSTSSVTTTLSEKPVSTPAEDEPGIVTRVTTRDTINTRTRTKTVPADTEPTSTSLPEKGETTTPTETVPQVTEQPTAPPPTTVPAKSTSVSSKSVGTSPISTDLGNDKPTTTTGFPLPTKTVDPDLLADNIKRAIKLNKNFAKTETGERCDPDVLLACQGTAGREIIQCEKGTYQSAHKCTQNANCYAVPQTLGSGTLVACLTPEDAAARFDMSVEEFNEEHVYDRIPTTDVSSGIPGLPPSPTASYTSTAVPPSTINIPIPSSSSPIPTDILSRADVAHSIAAYENLLTAAKGYRKALAAISSAASTFGAALEACARCKGAGPNGHGILNAGGLQYLIASNTHILSESLYRGFEVPLLHEIDLYKEKTTENEERFRKEESRRGKELHKREGEYLKLARQKRRNFSAYRTALTDLTHFIDELDKLKYEHYRIAHNLTADTSNRILECAALVVRAEVEIFEKVAQKGWDGAGGGLDDLIARAQDPFAPETGGEDAVNGNGTMFSILPAHSILPSPHSPVMGGVNHDAVTGGGGGGSGAGNGTGRGDGMYHQVGHGNGKFRALSPPARNLYDDEEDERSIFSAAFSNSTIDMVNTGSTTNGGVDDGEGGNGQEVDDGLSPPPEGEITQKLLPPPISPSASSAGWGGPNFGDEDVVPLELNSTAGKYYERRNSEETEVATIRPVDSDQETCDEYD